MRYFHGSILYIDDLISHSFLSGEFIVWVHVGVGVGVMDTDGQCNFSHRKYETYKNMKY